MKMSKLRGYIYDLEHKNKNFSFDKTLRILDISNAICTDLIKKTKFKEILEGFEEVNNFIEQRKNFYGCMLIKKCF